MSQLLVHESILCVAGFVGIYKQDTSVFSHKAAMRLDALTCKILYVTACVQVKWL